jgi:hypothetical protein
MALHLWSIRAYVKTVFVIIIHASELRRAGVIRWDEVDANRMRDLGVSSDDYGVK